MYNCLLGTYSKKNTHWGLDMTSTVKLRLFESVLCCVAFRIMDTIINCYYLIIRNTSVANEWE